MVQMTKMVWVACICDVMEREAYAVVASTKEVLLDVLWQEWVEEPYLEDPDFYAGTPKPAKSWEALGEAMGDDYSIEINEQPLCEPEPETDPASTFGA